MNSQQNLQYPENLNGNENISSDTLYLKERFKNNIESFNNTVQGLKQCMEQINRNQRENSNQRVDKYSRVEQMLLERRNKLNSTNQSSICQNTDRFNNQYLPRNSQLSNTSLVKNNLVQNQNNSLKSDFVISNKDEEQLSNNIINQSFQKHKKIQQQYQNMIEPDDEQFQNESNSFFRERGEDIIKQKNGVQKINKEGQNNIDNFKTERDSFGSTLFQIESSSFQGIQRLSEIHERKAEQFLQEFEDDDSIALPENICRLFPESSQAMERNRISELEREMERQSNGSVQNNPNHHHYYYKQEDQSSRESQAHRYDEQNYQSFQSQQDKLGQTQLEFISGENSTIIQEMNSYQLYSKQEHVLPIDDRQCAKKLNHEEKIRQLQEQEERMVKPELQKISKIINQSDMIVRNSSRLSENPELQACLKNDKIKKEQEFRQKQCQQISEDEHRFTFAPQINSERGENRVIKEGQQIQVKKKLQQENQNIKQMSNQKSMKRSMSNISGINSYSKLDYSSNMSTTNKTHQKQSSVDRKNLPQSHFVYYPKNLENENSQQSAQIDSQTEKTLNLHECYLSNNKIQNDIGNNYKQGGSVENNSSQQTLVNNSSFLKSNPINNNKYNKLVLQDVTNNIKFNKQDNSQAFTQNQSHHKTFSLHIDSSKDTSRNQSQYTYPLNVFKKSEKIVLPQSINGKVSVESLVQSAQFRKTKIFATDNQNMIIIDKQDSIPLSNKISGQSQKKKKEVCQIIDINQLLLNKQESTGTNNIQKIDQKNIFKGFEQQSQKENTLKTGRYIKLHSKIKQRINKPIFSFNKLKVKKTLKPIKLNTKRKKFKEQTHVQQINIFQIKID